MSDDTDLPPAEIPMDLPAGADAEAPSLEPKEFLVSGEQSEDVKEFDQKTVMEAVPEGELLPGEVPAGPAEAVDALLSAEVLPEGLETPIPEPAPALPEHPSFQLQFKSLADSARPAMKKALEAQGVTVSEKVWTAAVPVISQLTEFQAIALLQAARALGIAADAAVVMPNETTPSEEDLALGDLLAVPEAPAVTVEAAPSVTLPKGEKEVLLCTPDNLPGGTVRESFGIVLAHRSIARRLFREEDLRDKLEKELRAVPNRPAMALPSSHLQITLRDLLLDLRKSALTKGANSVLGVKIEAFPESGVADPQLEQLRLVAFGTAAVVEKS